MGRKRENDDKCAGKRNFDGGRREIGRTGGRRNKCLVEVKPFFPGGGEEPVAENFLSGIFGEFEVVDAGVD